jgi:hypothetical protein
MHIDPRSAQTVRISLDRKIPAIPVPPDTEYVKHVRFESPLLSKFWGQPILIGATILLPRGYDQNTQVAYPVLYEQGHFSTGAPAGFGEEAALKPDATDRERSAPVFARSSRRRGSRTDFPGCSTSLPAPDAVLRRLLRDRLPQHRPVRPGHHAGVDPLHRVAFRAIAKPWARILSGGSTGGWESLALQIFHPEFFGGTFSYCPDPVDFHYFEMVNIYEWDNAWHRQTGWIEVPIPGERAADGLVLSTMKQQLDYERAMGTRGRSGEDWDCWQAVVRPDRRRRLFPAALRSGDRGDRPQRGRVVEGPHGPDRVPRAPLGGDRNVSRREDPHLDRRHGHLYLNNAVYKLEEFLTTTRSPSWGGSITYGPRQPHCWAGPLSPADRFKGIAEYAAARAPRDADRAWWRD